MMNRDPVLNCAFIGNSDSPSGAAPDGAAVQEEVAGSAFYCLIALFRENAE
jgi:hypothetical protein